MNILAINTAGPTAQLALQADNKCTYFELDASMKHSENLLPAIEELLIKTNLTLKDLNFLAVNIGPGSFTGLRIAVATCKGLLLTNENIKAIKISAFELMAEEYFKSHSQKSANFVINGLSGFYFHCELSRNGEILTAPRMIEKSELLFDNVVSDENIEHVKSEVVKTTCENLINVALKKIEKKEFCPETELVPLYIRPSQAEYNLINKK